MNDKRRPDRNRRRGGRGNRQSGSGEPPRARSAFDEHEAILSLRDYVGRAADEIDRLRAKNEELASMIAELQAEDAEREPAGLLSPDEDPEKIRGQISSFIETIDVYLERYHTDSDETVVDAEGNADRYHKPESDS